MDTLWWAMIISGIAAAVCLDPDYVKKFKNYQLQYFKRKVNFDSAKSACVSRNAKLVEITSDEMNTASFDGIQDAGGGNYWIGITDSKNEGTWLLSNTETALPYKNWGGVEPNDAGVSWATEDCGEIIGATGTWIDTRCGKQRFYICQSGPVHVFTTSEYEVRYFHEKVNFDSAKSACESRNSKLLEIKDDKMNAAVLAGAKTAGGSKYWIGLNDRAEEGSWKWSSDESSVDYANWNNGEPYNHVEDCGEINSVSGKWTDSRCGYLRYYICQSDLNPVTFVGTYEYTIYRYNATSLGSLRLNRNDALKSCQETGRDLAAITSDATDAALNMDLADRTESGYWTSCNDIAVDGSWLWGDGSTLNAYQNWASGEPAISTSKNCLMKKSFDWEWYAEQCSESGPFICQKELTSGRCSDDICMNNGVCTVKNGKYECTCKEGFVGDKCHREPCRNVSCTKPNICTTTNVYPNYACCDPAYEGPGCEIRKFVTKHQCKYHLNMYEKITHDEARTTCLGISGSLAIVDNHETQEFLTESAKTIFGTNVFVFFWIGGEKFNGKWRWEDNSSIPLPTETGYSYWASFKPDDKTCLIETSWRSWVNSKHTKWTDLLWFDQNCTNKVGYVCEVPVSDPCSPSPCANGECLKTGCHTKCDCFAGFYGDTCASELITISPSATNATVIEGQNASLSLHVETIDGPVTVGLYKSVQSSPLRVMSNVINTTLTFVIGPLEGKDSCNYTFKAYPTSGAYVKTVKVEVIVHAPARIETVRPSHAEVTITRDILCQATGIPAPVVAWYRNETEPLPYSRSGSGNLYQTKDGPSTSWLRLPGSESEAGVYFCKAVNHIGEARQEVVVKASVLLTAPVALVSKSPADGIAIFRNFQTISCTFTGYPPPTIQWKWRTDGLIKPINSSSPASVFSVSNTTSLGAGGIEQVTSNLTISFLRCLDPMEIFCMADNNYSKAEGNFNIGRNVEQRGDQLFYFAIERLNYTDASAYCQNLGGKLASVPDQGTQDYFTDTIRRLMGNPNRVYLDATMKVENGIQLWRWSNGTLLYNQTKRQRWYGNDGNRIVDSVYVGWKYGWPQGRICLSMFKTLQYKWKDVDCYHRDAFICSLPNDSPVVNVKTFECNANMTIEWKPRPETVNLLHRITLTNFTDGSTMVVDTIPRDINDQSITLSPLLSKTLYSVTMEIAPGFCSRYNIASGSGMTGTSKPGKVVNATLTGDKINKTCSISWTPPRGKFDIVSYKITTLSEFVLRPFTNISNPDIEEVVNATGSSERLRHTIAGEPNRKYSIRIETMNCAGFAEAATASGTCVIPPEAPKVVSIATISSAFSEDGTIAVSVPRPDENRGPISCVFIIVMIGKAKDVDEIFTLEHLDEARKNAASQSAPSNGKYIALALEMSAFSEDLVNMSLGDGSTSTCNINGNFQPSRRKRDTSSSSAVYEGRNWELKGGQAYSFQTVTASPTGDSISLQQSQPQDFGPNKEPISDHLPSWVIGLIIALLVVIIAATVLAGVVYKRRKKPKLVNRAASDVTMNTLDDSGDAEGESAYVNVDYAQKKSSTSILLEDMREIYENMKQDEYKAFKEEFEELKSLKPEATVNAASDLSIKSKNRYKNILPYDHSRVTITGEEGEGYINACYIDGYQEPKKFIATQGPLPATVEDFWMMVLKENSKVVVMLAKCRENRKVKCAKYWPDLGQSERHGNIAINNAEEAEFGGIIRRTLRMKYAGKEHQTIHHYQYANWPDHGVPLTTSTFYRLHKAVAKSQSSGSSRSPIIVHCSAGAGRTGTFIGYDILLEEMQSSRSVDVYACVSNMRKQRMQMVQTWDQYVLIHKLILESYLFSDTDMSADEVKAKLGRSEAALSEEFQRLSIVGPMHTELHGHDPKHAKMNRNPAVIPYEKCKVVLMRLPEDLDSPYINASTIESYDGAIPLIAAQGPMSSTVALFWRTIWDSNVNTIVMLTELNENGKEQCVQYWPEEVGQSKTLSNLVISSEEESAEEQLITREFMVTKEKETRKIVQYQYTGWRSNVSRASATNVLDIVSKMVSNIRSEPAACGLVHCSDGAGRTGAFCAILNLIERLKCENKADVFRTVKDLRDCRPGMVQTLEEYRFCHRAVVDYLSSFDLYSNFNG